MSARVCVCSSCALFGLFADTNIKWRFVRDREKRDERKRVLRVHQRVCHFCCRHSSQNPNKKTLTQLSPTNRNNKTNNNVSSFNEKIHHRECSQQQYQQHFFIIIDNVFLVRVLHLHDDEGKKQLENASFFHFCATQLQRRRASSSSSSSSSSSTATRDDNDKEEWW